VTDERDSIINNLRGDIEKLKKEKEELQKRLEANKSDDGLEIEEERKKLEIIIETSKRMIEENENEIEKLKKLLEQHQPIPDTTQIERVKFMKISIEDFMNNVRDESDFTESELEILKISNELEFVNKIAKDGFLNDAFKLLKKLEAKNKLLEYEKSDLMQEFNVLKDSVLKIKETSEDGVEVDITKQKSSKSVNIPSIDVKSQVDVKIVNGDQNAEHNLRYSDLLKKIENDEKFFAIKDSVNPQNTIQSEICSIS
jgi:hypothetical protein